MTAHTKKIPVQGDYKGTLMIALGTIRASDGRRGAHALCLYLPVEFAGMRFRPRVTRRDGIRLDRVFDGAASGRGVLAHVSTTAVGAPDIRIAPKYVDFIIPVPPAQRLSWPVDLHWDGGKLTGSLPEALLNPTWTPDPNVDRLRRRRKHGDPAPAPAAELPPLQRVVSLPPPDRAVHEQARAIRDLAREEGRRLGLRWFINGAGDLDAAIMQEVCLDA